MNREEAKYVLHGYHLGGEDADDPQFRDALELVKCDPELASWFAREQAIDRKLADKFNSLAVPPDLKDQLLAARKVVRVRAWWRQPGWISAAACLAIIAVLAAVFFRPPAGRQFVDFRSYVADTTVNLDRLDLQTSDLRQIRDWLGDHKAPENFLVPEKLDGKSRIGCRVFAWDGRKVSMVCFRLEDRKVAHLFVMDASALKGLPRGSVPQFQMTSEGVATAAWTDAKRVYVLAMKNGEQDLKRLLL